MDLNKITNRYKEYPNVLHMELLLAPYHRRWTFGERTNEKRTPFPYCHRGLWSNP